MCDYKGKVEGVLQVHIQPCNVDGSLPSEDDDMFVEDPYVTDTIICLPCYDANVQQFAAYGAVVCLLVRIFLALAWMSLCPSCVVAGSIRNLQTESFVSSIFTAIQEKQRWCRALRTRSLIFGNRCVVQLVDRFDRPRLFSSAWAQGIHESLSVNMSAGHFFPGRPPASGSHEGWNLAR